MTVQLFPNISRRIILNYVKLRKKYPLFVSKLPMKGLNEIKVDLFVIYAENYINVLLDLVSHDPNY